MMVKLPIKILCFENNRHIVKREKSPVIQLKMVLIQMRNSCMYFHENAEKKKKKQLVLDYRMYTP